VPPSGSVLLGEKGTLLIPHVGMPRVYPASKETVEKMAKVPAINHYTAWVDACRGTGKTGSSFDYAGPLTECVLLGTIAIRCPEVTLHWDAEAMKLTESTEAAAMLKKAYRKGWEPAWV
jgi:hypothetical protein